MRTINLYYPDLASKKLGNKLAIRDDFQRNHLKVVKAGYLEYKYVCRDGLGLRAELELKKIDKREGALFEIIGLSEDTLPENRVRILIPFIRPANLEIALDQVTQLGVVFEIGLYFADYSRQTTKELSTSKLERFKKLVLTAFSQSGAALLPELKSFQNLKQAIDSWQDDVLLAERSKNSIIWLDLKGKDYSASSFREELEGARRQGRVITIVVGPEGGFSKEERAFLEGFEAQSSYRLPLPTLTTQNAATVAAALVACSL